MYVLRSWYRSIAEGESTQLDDGHVHACVYYVVLLQVCHGRTFVQTVFCRRDKVMSRCRDLGVRPKIRTHAAGILLHIPSKNWGGDQS